MKTKIIGALIFTILFGTMGSAQQIEITPSFGYMFNGKVQFAEGVLDIQNSPDFGLSLSTVSEGNFDLELDYTWASNTNLNFRSAFPDLNPDFDTRLNIHHISLNAVNYLGNFETIRPFFNLGAGVSVFDVDVADVESQVRLSLNAGIGLKYDITDRIGIRLQSRLIAPVHFEGVGLYAGIGTGGSSAGLSLNASVPIFEADVRAGLVIKLGNK